MSIEASQAKRAQQSELSDLQQDYSKKKKQLIENEEARLKDIQSSYTERRAQIQEQSQAAINHIQKKQTEEIAQAKEDRQKSAERGIEQTKKIDEVYTKKMNDTQRVREKQMAEIKLNQNEQINSTKQKNESNIEKLRTEGQIEYKKAQDRFHREKEKQRESQELQMAQQRQTNEITLKRELEKGRSTQEKVQSENDKEIFLVEKRLQDSVKEKKELNQNQIQRLDNDFEKSYKKQQAQWTNKEDRLSKDYNQRLQEQKVNFEDQKKLQKKHFDSIYEKTDKANRTQLQIQAKNFAKELAQLKGKFIADTQKYDGKEDDPFYKVQNRGSSLSETPNYYILEAYVPEHEKEKIQVVVHKDKASVSGQRAFKDNMVDEDGKKLSTQSFQSFREEFAFDQPVLTEGMGRERSGDYIIFTIPKMASFNGKSFINKKA